MTFAPGLINDRWPIVLPDFRVAFHAARPKWEAGRLAVMAERTEPGQTIIDGGAEHGDFTALYRQWVTNSVEFEAHFLMESGVDGPHPLRMSLGGVIPVEPAGHYWPCIRQTMEANGFAAPPCMSFHGFVAESSHHAARGSRVYEWPDASVGPVVADPGFLHLISDDPTVSRTTLDEIGERVPAQRIDHVVLDIEGAELIALHGARRLMMEDRPLFWVSVHPTPLAEWYGATPADIDEWMAQCDYRHVDLAHFGEGEDFVLFEPT